MPTKTQGRRHARTRGRRTKPDGPMIAALIDGDKVVEVREFPCRMDLVWCGGECFLETADVSTTILKGRRVTIYRPNGEPRPKGSWTEYVSDAKRQRKCFEDWERQWRREEIAQKAEPLRPRPFVPYIESATIEDVNRVAEQFAECASAVLRLLPKRRKKEPLAVFLRHFTVPILAIKGLGSWGRGVVEFEGRKLQALVHSVRWRAPVLADSIKEKWEELRVSAVQLELTLRVFKGHEYY